jgi:hypothetical protein
MCWCNPSIRSPNCGSSECIRIAEQKAKERRKKAGISEVEPCNVCMYSELGRPHPVSCARCIHYPVERVNMFVRRTELTEHIHGGQKT